MNLILPPGMTQDLHCRTTSNALSLASRRLNFKPDAEKRHSRFILRDPPQQEKLRASLPLRCYRKEDAAASVFIQYFCYAARSPDRLAASSFGNDK
jgi:hypothetical protein